MSALLKKRCTWITAVVTALGFLAGMLLRGPISGEVDWCRDIDYGNLPQWLALVVGAVVAGFTIWGILTARRAYLDDGRARKYAQARLVHAGISQFTVIEPNLERTIVVPRDNFVSRRFIAKTVNQPRYWRDGNTIKWRAASTSRIVVFLFEFANNSEEMISMKNIVLQTEDGVTFGYKQMNLSGALRPRDTAYLVCATDQLLRYQPVATIEFQDSSGQMWRRVGSEPVEPIGDAA
ncbi:hypothetical protein [Aeromicrobium fastidiosum]|uniref:Uncharacterized protein n=1 Tax=Aeromicrobium fastidiosum TaxID=52699 RepID=A0A641AR91_9ACTN|nr:hypothetical protein [Aeromicrobium fastidiosum]KAA1378765.1 hypothetical protein ESP62_010570 [Aeromicrobium fastidiosum]MBP2392242.1 hypothetical protein [Aeromicrobium fastidiosum]